MSGGQDELTPLVIEIRKHGIKVLREEIDRYIHLYPELSDIDKRYNINTYDGCTDALNYCYIYNKRRLVSGHKSIPSDIKEMILSGKLDSILDILIAGINE